MSAFGVGDIFSSSVSQDTESTTFELTGYVIVGSILMSLISYTVAGIWMVLSLNLRTHLTLCRAILVCGAVIVWGILSSLILATLLAIFIIQILHMARQEGTKKSEGSPSPSPSSTTGADSSDIKSALTAQYVLSIGISVGLLLNYRNIGRGWI
jgi:hypothetical protein